MKLSVDADQFIKHRIAIGTWLNDQKIPVELLIWPNHHKVQLRFEKTNDAWNFQLAFEDF
jgi:hypothetical protein